MIPSVIGILVIAAGIFLVYLGVHGHDKLLPIYPITSSGTGSAPAQ